MSGPASNCGIPDPISHDPEEEDELGMTEAERRELAARIRDEGRREREWERRNGIYDY